MSNVSSRDLVALTVLALLMERPRHPYQMQRVIRERRKDFATGDARRLYHAVERLQKRGLIEPSEVVREGRRPERTVYQITDDGKEEFHLSLSEMISIPAADFPIFTAAVAFLCYLPVETATRALQARVALLEGEVAEHHARLDHLKDHLHRLALLEAEYLGSIRRAEIEWVRALLDDIRSGRLTWDNQALIQDPGLMLRPGGPAITVVREPGDADRRRADG